MSKIKPINKSLCLQNICESNYQKLFNLIPNLLSFDNNAIGISSSKPELHLTIIDKAPYTLTIQLSHNFNVKLSDFLEPAVKIRIYLDTRSIEVLRDHIRKDVASTFSNPGMIGEIMDYKWTLNYFLEKWLNHCLKSGYQFIPEDELVEQELDSA